MSQNGFGAISLMVAVGWCLGVVSGMSEGVWIAFFHATLLGVSGAFRDWQLNSKCNQVPKARIVLFIRHHRLSGDARVL